MMKKTLKHFGALGIVLALALSIAPVTMQAQNGSWDRHGYNHHQQRDWDRYQRHEWREDRHREREWRSWERDRHWRKQSWRNDRWDRRYQRGYVPDRSFYFGYRY